MARSYRVVLYQPCEVRRSVTVEAESMEEAREIASARVPGPPEYATVLRAVGPARWDSVVEVEPGA